ncbi:MAG: aldehyde dehydrogenase family protein [Spongiibacteraceae bacterium]
MRQSMLARNGMTVSVPNDMLIGGEWVPALSGARSDVIDPATGALIATAPAGDAADIDRAVLSAKQAFDQQVWLQLGAKARARILWRVADLMEKYAEELAALDTLNMGMPYAQILHGVVPKAVEAFRYFSGWCTKINGITADISEHEFNVHAYTLRQPVGVVGLIVPWNAPLPTAAWKIAPALAAGCTCVLKPSEETPLTALRLGEILLEAGVPPGVVNVVTGYGHTAGAALTAHRDVSKIGFTGSTEVGKIIVRAAADNLKKVTLELGGKSPFIIFDDADLSKAIPQAAIAIFSNAGQMCVAGSRMFVQRSVYEGVLQGMAQAAAAFKTGDGFEESAVVGPIISSKQLSRVTELVDSGIAAGGRVVCGARPSDRPGFFFEPTVIADVTPDMRIYREEIFGPVLSVIPFDTEEQALAMANDTDYGLASYVWTQNVSRAHRFAQSLEAGSVWINSSLMMDYAMPFGGYKQSGWGREGGQEGLDAFLQTKSVCITL